MVKILKTISEKDSFWSKITSSYVFFQHLTINSRTLFFSLVCSEIPFSKNLYHIETGQLICICFDWFLYDTIFYWKLFPNTLKYVFQLLLLSVTENFPGFFNHLLRVVLTRGALFEKCNALFSVKNSKNTCRLVGCSVVNAQNLEKLGLKIHNCALLLNLFFGSTASMPLLSRKSPDFKEVSQAL